MSNRRYAAMKRTSDFHAYSREKDTELGQCLLAGREASRVRNHEDVELIRKLLNDPRYLNSEHDSWGATLRWLEEVDSRTLSPRARKAAESLIYVLNQGTTIQGQWRYNPGRRDLGFLTNSTLLPKSPPQRKKPEEA